MILADGGGLFPNNWITTEGPQWWLVAAPVLLLVIEAVGIATACHALRYVRTSQATVAWVVGLLTVPVLTIPLYWVFARNRFSGYREAIRRVGQRHRESVDAVRRELATESNTRSTALQTPLDHVADVLDTPISADNRFELLIDGDAFFDAVEQQIDSATDYVYCCFYIIRDDACGGRFAEALIRQAKAGRKVRLLYDEVGCAGLRRRYLNRLKDGGVDVRSFNTRQGPANRFQINFRNHRKLVVVDGTSAIIGGLNIGDEYRGVANWIDGWRDTAVAVVGPLARKVQAVFAGDYYWAAGLDLAEANWGPTSNDDAPPNRRDNGQQGKRGLAAVCATGPADHLPRASMMFAAAASIAKSRLWISTPYLVPDEAVMVALASAKARGVDVKILIPAVADHWAVYLAGFYYEHELAEMKIPVYRYKDGLLHQKCVLIDDDLVLIGSTNLDNRSLHLNFELMVAIEQADFVRDVYRMLVNDLKQCHGPEDRAQITRPWTSRLGTAIARLFSPIL
ncbi:cardiolipin synthase [Crateriforma conspicua]|uniref:Cardiolipin synthase n=1 Tax=Crateriforma conspicua TaxID=2527996 RepID=A0A5C5Y859_9PLAN|nr:cardiolipin synthase [Crateriforma conspicua]TWT71856.1 Major cardiolipin synthase ClsA [Crateriforma conspicua]